MSDDDKRIIPDGAHHSGLMKDYGGQYNPEFSQRHAEAAESLLRDAVIRADAADAELTRLRTREAVLVKALTEIGDGTVPGTYPALRDGDWKAVAETLRDAARKALATKTED